MGRYTNGVITAGISSFKRACNLILHRVYKV